MVDVNSIPEKAAVRYLKNSVPGDPEEAEMKKVLLDLLEQGLIEAVYHEGHVAYRGKGDPFSFLTTILSDCSEEEITAMLPELMNIREEYLEKREPSFEKGSVSGPLVEALKKLRSLARGQPKAALMYAYEQYALNEYVNQEITSKILEYVSMLSEAGNGVSELELGTLLDEIQELLEEEERRIIEHERRSDQFFELLESLQDHRVSGAKKTFQGSGNK